jgi:hypothetical protein
MSLAHIPIHSVLQSFLFTHKEKIPLNKYEGIYRCVWGDSIIVRAGDILIDFHPQAVDPLKQADRLIPTSIANTFVLKSNNLYSSYGEKASFSDFKKGKAEKYISASMPLRRVKP